MKIQVYWQTGWILMVQQDRHLVAVLIRRSGAKNDSHFNDNSNIFQAHNIITTSRMT